MTFVFVLKITINLSAIVLKMFLAILYYFDSANVVFRDYFGGQFLRFIEKTQFLDHSSIKNFWKSRVYII